MVSDYKKIFTGDSLAANRIVSKLHEIGIEAIAKDEANRPDWQVLLPQC